MTSLILWGREPFSRLGKCGPKSQIISGNPIQAVAPELPNLLPYIVIPKDSVLVILITEDKINLQWLRLDGQSRHMWNNSPRKCDCETVTISSPTNGTPSRSKEMIRPLDSYGTAALVRAQKPLTSAPPPSTCSRAARWIHSKPRAGCVPPALSGTSAATLHNKIQVPQPESHLSPWK